MFRKKTAPAEKILILGLGGVGLYLAKRLIHEEYAITIIEPDATLVAHADGQIDARLIKGSAMDISFWKEAHAEKMDYLIAVTDNDAVNMMAAMIADSFGIAKKIARVRSSDFGNSDSILTAEDLKLDLLIHPEELVAQEIVRLIQINSSNEIIDIAQGEIQLLATGIDKTSPLANKKLKDIAGMYDNFPFRVVAIARGISTIIPGGDELILPNDHIFIMAAQENLPSLMELTGVRKQRQQKVMVLGGGLVGSRIAELLEKSVSVKLLEKDEQRALELSSALAHTDVMHGDGSDGDVLAMAGLHNIDTFVTTTGENETNIMTCLLAKHLIEKNTNGNKKKDFTTIALVSKEDYLVLAATIGSDIALNKKVMAGNEILKFIRRSEFLSVAHLHGFDTEVVELAAAEKSPITQKPLSKLDTFFQDKLIIGAVFRDEIWHIAVGDTHIQAGESVIVICLSKHLKDVRKLFIS
ncbi:MAG: Trk system potassium transport protein TrkA [Desulfobulbaceae bacterium S3730MH12]|nr:MAG: Trk system potassium transport protein TrkA [Desulfobulbaceae bacterium S5133MH15]OEU56852.1 MAG: Trk system potassium transport protein TrkA [Desulfobulbaceae bacterium S3730MH12]OEU81949.1 MAG: Trk system potassium transport protein TrkA [Desulfobulbaceae bacterium C00003063]